MHRMVALQQPLLVAWMALDFLCWPLAHNQLCAYQLDMLDQRPVPCPITANDARGGCLPHSLAGQWLRVNQPLSWNLNLSNKSFGKGFVNMSAVWSFDAMCLMHVPSCTCCLKWCRCTLTCLVLGQNLGFVANISAEALSSNTVHLKTSCSCCIGTPWASISFMSCRRVMNLRMAAINAMYLLWYTSQALRPWQWQYGWWTMRLLGWMYPNNCLLWLACHCWRTVKPCAW